MIVVYVRECVRFQDEGVGVPMLEWECQVGGEVEAVPGTTRGSSQPECPTSTAHDIESPL